MKHKRLLSGAGTHIVPIDNYNHGATVYTDIAVTSVETLADKDTVGSVIQAETAPYIFSYSADALKIVTTGDTNIIVLQDKG